MSRIIDFKTLSEYLREGCAATERCATTGTRFALDPEQLSDARWQIQLHISALDRLEQMLVSQALSRLDLKVFRTNRCKSATQQLCDGSLPVEDANNIREGRILY